MEEELRPTEEEVLDNWGLPRPEVPRGIDIAPEEFVIESSELMATEAIDSYANDTINRFLSNSDAVEQIRAEEENLIGDEDYVIDVETAPTYTGPTREQFNQAVVTLSEEDIEETIESMNAHIDEILEREGGVEEVEEETPFSLSPEEEELINLALEEVVVTPSPETIIPANSDTILISQTTSRFSSAEWFNQIQQEQVILAGIGGIGSYIGFLLGRLSIGSMVIYDDDIVDAVNLSGQLYNMTDINTRKVDALSKMIISYANYYKVITHPTKFTETSIAGPIMICGFDNMIARRTYFNSWINYVGSLPEEKRKDCLFIDGRLAAEEYQILCMRGDDTYSINKYHEEFLFTDAQADPTLCSYKQTSFMANQIASNMVNLFVNFIANKCEPIIDRYLPFYTEYNAETMFFKTVS